MYSEYDQGRVLTAVFAYCSFQEEMMDERGKASGAVMEKGLVLPYRKK